MAFNIADRVKETTTTTGTGSISLAGAVTGYVSFSSAIGNGNTCYYTIQTQTETEWEVGLGTVSVGVLSRDTVLASSNSGALVNFSAGTKYVFNTEPAIHLKSLVPYTGATASVNLGTYGLTTDFAQYAITPTTAGAVGQTWWNDTDGTLNIGLKGGNVTLQVGQEQVLRVVNKTGATLTEAGYSAVYVSGAQGQRPKVALALADADATSAGTIGLVTETIANNAEGFITTSGIVRGINTTGSLQSQTWADGDIIYLSPTTAGGLTNVKPTAPNHTVVIGYVVHAHVTQGQIFVKVDNGYEIGELHDVYAPLPSAGQGLFWNVANNRYQLDTVAGILGYTPANDSLVMHLAGSETATGYKTFSIGLQTNTGDNYLNYTSGATYIGYNAAPVGGYKLAVNGKQLLEGIFEKKLYTDTSAGVNSLKVGTAYELFGTLHSAGGYSTYLTTTGFASGWNLIIGNSTYQSLDIQFNRVDVNVDLRAKAGMSNITGNGSMSTYFSSPYEGFKPTTSNGWGFGIFNSANSVMAAVKYTGQLLLSNYTSTSSFTGTVAGLLGFDSSGNVITTASGGISGSGTAGQVTYWTGSSAVGGSSNLVWDNTNSRLGIGINSPQGPLHINGDITAATNGLTITRTNVLLSDANFQFTSGTNNSGQFLPTLTFTSNFLAPSYTIGGFFSARITNGNSQDIGLLFDARTKSASALTQGYILSVRSYTTDYFRIAASGNTIIQNGGTFTDAGYRLDVNGTGASTGALRVTGGNVQFGSATGLNWDNTNSRLLIGTSSSAFDLHVLKNQNAATIIRITNTNNNANAYASFELSTTSFGSLFKHPTLRTYKFIVGDDLGFYNSMAGNISILNDYSSGSIKLGAGGSSTPNLTIESTGAITTAGNKMTIAAATTSYASLNIPSGTAPTSPANGDIWFTGTDLKIQVGGTTKTFTLI